MSNEGLKTWSPLSTVLIQDPAMTWWLDNLEYRWQATKAYFFRVSGIDTAYPLPKLNRLGKQHAQALAEILAAYYNLCIEIHPLAIEVYGYEYSSAWQWFDRIGCETRKGIFAEAMNEARASKPVTELRASIKLLSDEENFCCPKEEPHTWRLLEVALRGFNTKGYDNRVKPLLYGKRVKNGGYSYLGLRGSLTHFAALIERPEIKMAVVENGKLLVRQGRGNKWGSTPIPRSYTQRAI